MTGTIYLEKRNEELFKQITGRIFDFRSYTEGILQAEVHTSQFLSRLSSSFAIGRTGLWSPEVSGKEEVFYDCVRIRNNPEYPRPGIAIADCSNDIIDEHYSAVAKNLSVKRMPLVVGVEGEGSFEHRVFGAYNKPSIAKSKEMGSRFIIYRT